MPSEWVGLPCVATRNLNALVMIILEGASGEGDRQRIAEPPYRPGEERHCRAWFHEGKLDVGSACHARARSSPFAPRK